MSDTMTDTMEGLYLIHTREFISTNKEIFKIGRNNNIKNILNYYPKGSSLLLSIINKNSIQSKKDLIKKFKEIFTQKLLYGNEYFEGNKYEMIKLMCEYINTNNEEFERKKKGEGEGEGEEVKDE